MLLTDRLYFSPDFCSIENAKWLVKQENKNLAVLHEMINSIMPFQIIALLACIGKNSFLSLYFTVHFNWPCAPLPNNPIYIVKIHFLFSPKGLC